MMSKYLSTWKKTAVVYFNVLFWNLPRDGCQSQKLLPFDNPTGIRTEYIRNTNVEIYLSAP
jgi:hypothetical protein